MWPTLEFLRTITVQLTKKKILSLVSVFHKTWNLAFSRRCRAVTAKKCRKRCDARAKLICIFKKPIAFLMFSLPCLSDLKTPIVWKTWWASFVYLHFKGVEGNLGMFEGQFSKQYPLLTEKETCEQTKTIRRRHVYIKSIKQLLPLCQSVKTLSAHLSCCR